MSIVRYTLVRKDGEIQSFDEPHAGTRLGKWVARSPKVVMEGTDRFVVIRTAKYHITGPPQHFEYRLRRSLFLFKHTGLQRIWIEGDPAPFYLGAQAKDWRDKNLQDTARAIWNITEYDNPERLMKPRKVDWVVILLVGLAALGIGFALGGRF